MYGRTSPFRGTPPVVLNLLILNLILFVGSYILGSSANIDLTKYLALYYWKSPNFQPYQFVTHMFMHANLTHIFFNMFALWMFGRVLESVWGPKRFFIYYFVTGFGAALLHLLVNHIQIAGLMKEMSQEEINIVIKHGYEVLMWGNNYANPNMGALNIMMNIPTVGASGAVFGVLLAFGMLFPNTRLMLLFLPIPIKAKYFVIFYGVAELYFAVLNRPGDNVAHFAHLGGMIFGFVLVKLWQKDRKNFY